jgi:hypothetical protein
MANTIDNHYSESEQQGTADSPRVIPEYDKRFDVDEITEVVNTRNVMAAIQYTRETRELVRDLERQIDWLTKEINIAREQVSGLLVQVGMLRGEVYGGGPTEV